MISEEQAVLMIDPRNLDTLLHPQFDVKALKAATPMGYQCRQLFAEVPGYGHGHREGVGKGHL